MTVDEHRETLRNNYAAQMKMLGYQPDGNPRDLVEVIRCKDCIYWDKGHSEQCDNSDSVCFHNEWCKPDWFCADGERRKVNG